MFLVFDGCFLLVDLGNDSHIEFGCAVLVVEKTVLFLLNVGKLRVAEAEHSRVVENSVSKSLVSFVELFVAEGRLSVAPACGSSAGFVIVVNELEADTAVLGDKYGLTLPGLTCLESVVKLAFLVELVVVFLEYFGILLVIVDIVDIGNNVVVAACVDARTGGVVELCLLVNYAKKVGILTLSLRTVIPCLIEGTPADKRGMVEIALYRCHPVGKECGEVCDVRIVNAPVAVFAPDYVTHLVAVVEVSRFKYLLMESRAVEACVKTALNILDKSLFAGSGEDSVGIEALVENETLENALAVEKELSVLHFDGSETEIALYLVLSEADNEIVETACAELPYVLFGKLNFELSVDREILLGCLADLLALVEYFGRKIARAAELCVYGNRYVFKIGNDLCVLNVAFGNDLVPDGLPDTRGSCVVAAVRLVSRGLLAAGLSRRACIVVASDSNDIFACIKSGSDVIFKRSESADMWKTDRLSVYPKLGFKVCRTDMEDNSVSAELLLSKGKSLLVPNAEHKILVAYSGKLGFGAEGESDLARKSSLVLKTSVFAARTVVDLKEPFAV